MSAGRQFLEMVNSSPARDIVVEIELDVGGGYSWTGLSLGAITTTFALSGNDLTFVPSANIEYTQDDDQVGTANVRGIRIKDDENQHLFPETTFTAIEVPFESTLRFTELKLTLT